MKNIFFALVASVTFFSFNPSISITISNSIANTLKACKSGQCQATIKSTGQQCKRCVSKDGDKYCYQHK